jgi:hypothetical protein
MHNSSKEKNINLVQKLNPWRPTSYRGKDELFKKLENLSVYEFTSVFDDQYSRETTGNINRMIYEVIYPIKCHSGGLK